MTFKDAVVSIMAFQRSCMTRRFYSKLHKVQFPTFPIALYM